MLLFNLQCTVLSYGSYFSSCDTFLVVILLYTDACLLATPSPFWEIQDLPLILTLFLIFLLGFESSWQRACYRDCCLPGTRSTAEHFYSNLKLLQFWVASVIQAYLKQADLSTRSFLLIWRIGKNQGHEASCTRTDTIWSYWTFWSYWTVLTST